MQQQQQQHRPDLNDDDVNQMAPSGDWIVKQPIGLRGIFE
jgi:hypothetical protein